MRYRAVIQYDGTAYFGFQRQAEPWPTVQSAIEEALTTLAGLPIRIVGAGRTDTGVHAAGQVIAFDMAWRHGKEVLLRALNATLPPDISVSSLQRTTVTFHPRFDVQRRRYRYTIWNAPTRDALKRLTSWHVAKPLDIGRMNIAAAHLVGVHDFATFGQPPQGSNTVRELFVANWQRDGAVVTFEVEATAFLQRMVRSLVGSLKWVGQGRWSPETFAEALAACDRSCSGPTAPPQGLSLIAVTYAEGDSAQEE